MDLSGLVPLILLSAISALILKAIHALRRHLAHLVAESRISLSPQAKAILREFFEAVHGEAMRAERIAVLAYLVVNRWKEARAEPLTRLSEDRDFVAVAQEMARIVIADPVARELRTPTYRARIILMPQLFALSVVTALASPDMPGSRRILERVARLVAGRRWKRLLPIVEHAAATVSSSIAPARKT